MDLQNTIGVFFVQSRCYNIFMIYFSELKGKKVLSEDKITIGQLDDVIFSAITTPLITKLVVIDLQKNKQLIPITYLKKINNEIIIDKAFTTSILEENELFVLRNLLDKQIIDIKGNKIIRVNDVAFQEKGNDEVVKGIFYIAGVDVGLGGILRWLKIEDILYKLLGLLKIKLTSEFLSWADIQLLELVHGAVKLKKTEEKLNRIRPEDLADYLERTNVSSIEKILKIMDEKQAAEVVGNLNLSFQADIFKSFSSEQAAKVLHYLDPDDATDILLTLNQKRRKDILDKLPEKNKKDLEYLLSLSVTQIGTLMTTEYLSVRANDTIREVVDIIKKTTGDFSYLNHAYVNNKNDQLIGVFNLHELLLPDLDTPIYKFMIQDVIVVHLTTSVELALRKMIKYALQSLPVVDNNKKILGVVTIIDVIKSYLKKINKKV